MLIEREILRQFRFDFALSNNSPNTFLKESSKKIAENAWMAPLASC